MNSVTKSLLCGNAFASSAFEVWSDLKERFDRVDGSRTYSLHKDIVTIQQGTASVSVYYTKLKTLWDEFEVLVLSPGCNCEKSRGFVAHMNRQKLYQFLMGLNESYHQARGQILMMDPLPSINHAYALVVGDESQRSVVTRTNSLGMNVVGTNSIALYSKSAGSSGVSQRFKKNSLLVCDFCKCKGHSKEFCYKIVGYPPDFKSKRKVQETGSDTSYSDQHQSGQALFSYGMNTNVNVNTPGWGRKVEHQHVNNEVLVEPSIINRPMDQAEKDVKQLLNGCTFTKD